MSKTVGTLKEIGAQVGDVVEFVHPYGQVYRYIIAYAQDGTYYADDSDDEPLGNAVPWRLVSRAVPQDSAWQPGTPKLWRDMTPEEKGALLLAQYEDKTLQTAAPGDWRWSDMPTSYVFTDDVAYRVKPGPTVETVTRGWSADYGVGDMPDGTSTHTITLTLRDGKPDPIAQVEELK